MKALLAFLTIALLAGCAAPLPEDGPDTPQRFDDDGNPNFGPR